MPKSYSGLIDIIIDLILNSVIPILFGLTIAVFLWGGVQFIKSAGDEKGRESGKKMLLYGIIGIAVMVGFWGLVKILTGTLGVSLGIPQLK